MRDFPVFTTDFGVATLVLKEVPYKEVAYIIIQSALQPEELLKECVSFCRAVGAEKIYARGHETVEQYPLHTIIYEMHVRGFTRHRSSGVRYPGTFAGIIEREIQLNEIIAVSSMQIIFFIIKFSLRIYSDIISPFMKIVNKMLKFCLQIKKLL